METQKSIEVKTEEKLALNLGSIIKTFLQAGFALMRPRQWIKNAFVFAGLIFSQNLLDFHLFVLTASAFVAFCFLSSSVYIINDIVDIEEDRHHPLKKNRPLAAGTISTVHALFIMALLLAASFTIAIILGLYFTLISLAYLALISGYTFWFKHLVIIDIFAISAGFLLRVAAGTVVIGVGISPWLLICTLLISLFLALIKRRHEYISMENGGADHRKVLTDYSASFIDQMISIVTAATIMAYSLYTFTASQTELLMLTIPFVIYGLLRYLYLVHKKEMGGSPEEVLLKDKPLLVNISLWVIFCMVILYIDRWGIFEWGYNGF